MVCNSFFSPLDMQCLLVNTFTGSWTIFGVIALLGIVMLSARFRMMTFTVGGIIALFAVLFAGELPWIYWPVIVFVGIFIAAMIGRFFTR